MTPFNNTYDELGRLKTKLLGNSIETENYEYNIRGWLLGMNRDYAKGGGGLQYFGYDLGYDRTAVKPAGGSPIGSFTIAQYNGNIEGSVWKSVGDGEIRKFDYSYDNANRLLAAGFTQYANSTFSTPANIDFSVGNLSYDANGNIGSMSQKGIKAGAAAFIDQLSYTYQPNSNKLQAVTDASNDNTSPLGDFKYDGSTKTATDYTYDGNGNLSTDANKKMSTPIDYNYLNLPAVVTMTGKGTIGYTYDAAGNKLQKVVTDNTVSPAKVTTTLYLGGAVYQNDTLQFMATEEGRVRLKSDGTFTYDYFLKDHLGNVRMVLTEEQKTDTYPTLDWEGTSGTAAVTNQDSVWSGSNGQAVGVTTNRAAKTSVPGQPFPAANGNYVRKLQKSTGSFGGGALLKVMSGDVINTSVDYFYNTTSASNNTANGLNTLVTSLLAAITGSPAVNSAAKAGASTATSNMNAAGSTADIFLNGEDPSSTANQPPAAYMHVLLFNEQFVFDNVNSYVERVTTANVVKNIAKSVAVKKNGYAYVYFSNESESVVWFDNLQLTHQRGRILEKTHYYPFGLTMAGISSKAAGGVENRKKYNGIELDEDLGIEEYEAYYRDLDPQTGRWWQIDPKTESMEMWSPYASNYDNPIRYNDFKGDDPCCGFDWNPDRKGNFVEPTSSDIAQHPIKSLIQEVGYKIFAAAGLNLFDDLGADLGNPNLSTSDKVNATMNATFSLVTSAGPEGLSVEGGMANEVKGVAITKIEISEENKISRELLNNPEKPGNAPTFKSDNKKVEIHHIGQEPNGPFKEMHPNDHRGAGNDKINHPNKNEPSKIDRKEFNKMKTDYWIREFYPERRKKQ